MELRVASEFDLARKKHMFSALIPWMRHLKRNAVLSPRSYCLKILVM
jgi:hypothetical protein